MKRVPFSQVLKNAKIDIQREYSRLYSMFYGNVNEDCSIEDICRKCFHNYPFKDTCISLEDFNENYGYHFEEQPKEFDEDYLIWFCEYSYNIAKFNCGMALSLYDEDPVRAYLIQVERVIEKIGYMKNDVGGITEFVPRDQAAIAVAEIVDPSLSYRVIEYNHHSMKGDLERKREILLALANKMEPERSRLNQINQTMASDLFFLLNNLNIRHSNTDLYMEDIELEQWYDETYQLFLLSFLELDNVERKERVKKFKEKVTQSKSGL